MQVNANGGTSMEINERGLSRRSALGVFGAATAAATVATTATALGGPGAASASAASSTAAHGGRPSGADVALLLNGSPASVGTYTFPDAVDSLVLDNGLVKFTFGRDDAAGGIVTGWDDVSITATSVVVNGVELAHNLNGVDPRDPDRQHSFYIDASGGKTRLVCSQVRVLRTTPDLAEVAFIDNTGMPLQHEHHLIMRRGKPGLYGYDILTAPSATTINEVRMNARWDRSILDHSYNWERGSGQQPTYAYLATQERVGDETWRVDGINNPALPSPDSNSGNLPPGTVYTKYNWSLYHRENPMFGHYGNGFGAWFTPLGGVTDDTLTAFYGVGPQHQDLAIHQDALILNYFGANHYGLPSYPLAAGYRRLYGPWFTYVTAGNAADPDAMIADAAAIAQREIEENRAGSAWVADPLYPTPQKRTTVTGRLQLADGRPAGGYWVLLSTQDATDVYTIHEPTYFVKTDADGSFELPGIPPAWQPGTTTPGAYTLYIFGGDSGSVTDQYKRGGITVSGGRQSLGTILWTPTNRTSFLWQVGGADRMGGEYALAANPIDMSNPRSYEKPSLIPGDLTFTVGESWEPKDWYYAQANAGTWTIAFDLGRAYTGTAYLTVSSSLQSGHAPTVAVNGSTAGITGTLPQNNDSTIGRQADRSGYPRLATLSFPASMLTVGANTITLSRTGSGGGMGWDTLLLEVDETDAAAAARLVARVLDVSSTDAGTTWKVAVDNTGKGDANDVRLDSVSWHDSGHARSADPVVTDRDPKRFPVPVTERIRPGETATATVTVDASTARGAMGSGVVIGFSANGGRTRSAVRGKAHGA